MDRKLIACSLMGIIVFIVLIEVQAQSGCSNYTALFYKQLNSKKISQSTPYPFKFIRDVEYFNNNLYVSNDYKMQFINKYDNNGNFLSQVNIGDKPFYMSSSNDRLFVLTTWNADVTVFDDSFNAISTIKETNEIYPYGIYYDKISEKLYVEDDWGASVLIYDKNLIKIDSFKFGHPEAGYSVHAYNDIVYVGIYGNIILVYQNKVLMNEINPCDSNDEFRLILSSNHCEGVLLVTCSIGKKIVLFKIDGINLRKIAEKSVTDSLMGAKLANGKLIYWSEEYFTILE